MGTSAGLTLQAPQGAHFEYDSVKTDRGTKDLGQVPLLIWDSIEAARAFYGDEGIVAVLDGTSLRVSFQSIARRGRTSGKSDDEIAKAQLEFRPGKRQGGVSTPASRAANVAKRAAEKVNGDAIAELLTAIAEGRIGEEQLRAFGISQPLAVPVAEETEEAEEVENNEAAEQVFGTTAQG